MLTTETRVALDGVTATTTTTAPKIYVGDAKRIGILLRRADHSSGNSAFAVYGSLDSKETTTPTMTAFNLCIDNVTADAGVATPGTATFYTHVNGKTLSDNGDAMLWIDPSALVTWLQIQVTETTDGTHSAWIVIQK